MKEAKGIYVSHNNGKIDWKAVAEAGIQFAFAELTTAGKDQDKSFEYNFKGMKDNGITAGAYHVFRVSVPHLEDNFMQLLIRWIKLSSAWKINFSLMLPQVFVNQSKQKNVIIQ